jgi:nitronate monooxygenase
MWPDIRLLDLLDLEVPLVQAPMAGADSPALAAAVSSAGGLGSIGCALLSPEEIEAAARTIRERTNRPFNLNFFCHAEPDPDPDGARAWLARLGPYYAELEAEPPAGLAGGRAPFDEELCSLVEAVKPSVVSFHFGLPQDALLDRVKAAGCRILCSATTPEEAVWLEQQGVDAIVAQGAEAGGHRGVFAEDWRTGSGMIGTLSLVPQVVDAVDLPVIATGGIADGRTIAACLALGAAGVQIGTAYLFTPEAGVSDGHRAVLAGGRAADSQVTNVMTGRPARGLANRLMREVGPIAEDAPEFPLASPAAAPLRKAAEAKGSFDFTPLWAGQSVAMGRSMPAADLTRRLAEEAQDAIAQLSAARS